MDSFAILTRTRPSVPQMFWLSLAVQSIIAISFPISAFGYIPAAPANSTLDGTGLDVHDNSSLIVTWKGNGLYGTGISYQLMGNGSAGISKGALIRIQENDIVNNDTTSTPWIAFINCDRNSTNMTLDNDIFTMVQTKGAIAALLYSNTSDGCLVNKEYLDGGFDALFDVFTTKSGPVAQVIYSQYQHVNQSYAVFNSQLLNDSNALVKDALALDSHNNSPYLVATLRSSNAPAEDPGDQNPIPTAPAHNSGSSSSNSQSLAMIILYVIVSVVSALFIIVILSGAVRAFRHPERYGPRLYHPGMDGEEGQSQTRAAGIARAVLDTFPVVKFGPHNGSAITMDSASYLNNHEGKDKEAINLPRRSELLHVHQTSDPPSEDSHAAGTLTRSSLDTLNQQRSLVSPPGATETTGVTSPSDFDPAAIGTETCPICIVDFEEGDDLRVLPCDVKHRFHKDCVDPWLLELSSSCPICREDFQALETMATAAGTEEHEEEEGDDRFPQEPSTRSTSTTTTSRFARYMRFAQRRRRSQRDSNTSSSRNAAHPPAPYTDY